MINILTALGGTWKKNKKKNTSCLLICAFVFFFGLCVCFMIKKQNSRAMFESTSRRHTTSHIFLSLLYLFLSDKYFYFLSFFKRFIYSKWLDHQIEKKMMVRLLTCIFEKYRNYTVKNKNISFSRRKISFSRFQYT